MRDIQYPELSQVSDLRAQSPSLSLSVSKAIASPYIFRLGKMGVPTRHFGVHWFDWVAHGTQRDTYANCLFYFRARVSLCNSRWPGTHCIGQADLELRDQRLPPQVLELEVCTPTPGLRVSLWEYITKMQKKSYTGWYARESAWRFCEYHLLETSICSALEALWTLSFWLLRRFELRGTIHNRLGEEEGCCVFLAEFVPTVWERCAACCWSEAGHSVPSWPLLQ